MIVRDDDPIFRKEIARIERSEKVAQEYLDEGANYVSDECSAESEGNLGGTIYPLVFSSCILSLTRQRVKLVQSITHTLSKQEKKLYPAGSFPVVIGEPSGAST